MNAGVSDKKEVEERKKLAAQREICRNTHTSCETCMQGMKHKRLRADTKMLLRCPQCNIDVLNYQKGSSPTAISLSRGRDHISKRRSETADLTGPDRPSKFKKGEAAMSMYMACDEDKTVENCYLQRKNSAKGVLAKSLLKKWHDIITKSRSSNDKKVLQKECSHFSPYLGAISEGVDADSHGDEE